MSNDMVMVPRDLLQRLQERLDCHRDARDWGLVCNALLATPAAQPVDEDAERAAFETAMQAEGLQLLNPIGGRYYMTIQCAWMAWKMRAALAAPVQAEQEPPSVSVPVMQFQMKHPSSGETHVVEFTRAEVADGMEDTLYEKLGDLVCSCNGEADHECGDYIHDFDLLTAIPQPAAPVRAVRLPDGYCIMPRRLTAENGAKALLLGEFKLRVTMECPECRELDDPLEGCEICDGEGEYGQSHMISWDQIKHIYSVAVKGLALDSAATQCSQPTSEHTASTSEHKSL